MSSTNIAPDDEGRKPIASKRGNRSELLEWLQDDSQRAHVLEVAVAAHCLVDPLTVDLLTGLRLSVAATAVIDIMRVARSLARFDLVAAVRAELALLAPLDHADDEAAWEHAAHCEHAVSFDQIVAFASEVAALHAQELAAIGPSRLVVAFLVRGERRGSP
jgi:hypothetical protein